MSSSSSYDLYAQDDSMASVDESYQQYGDLIGGGDIEDEFATTSYAAAAALSSTSAPAAPQHPLPPNPTTSATVLSVRGAASSSEQNVGGGSAAVGSSVGTSASQANGGAASSPALAEPRVEPVASTSTIKPVIKSTLPINPNLPANPMKSSAGSGVTTFGARKMNALYLGELHWWTSDDDIRDACEQAGAPLELKNIHFSEHKVNGKSKGVVYVEFSSAEFADYAKAFFEQNDFQGKRITVELTQGGNGQNNPFRTLPREPNVQNQNRPLNNRPLNNNFNNNNNNSNRQGPDTRFNKPLSASSSSHSSPQLQAQLIPPPPPPPPMAFSQAPMMPMNLPMNPMGMMPPYGVFPNGMGGMGGVNPMMGMMGMGGMGMGGMGFAPNSGVQNPGIQQQQWGNGVGAGGGFNPMFYGANVGSVGGNEFGDDGSRKRTRMEG